MVKEMNHVVVDSGHASAPTDDDDDKMPARRPHQVLNSTPPERNLVMLNPAPTRPRRRLALLAAIAALVALVVPLGAAGLATAESSQSSGTRPTIVLVHGDWADGSSWSAVIQRLQDRGFTVVAPPNPLQGPTEDSAYLASYLHTISGPIVLVGHSYGGFVITNAATGNANVKALVYIDAFIPDVGQTLASLSSPASCLDPATAFNAVPFAGGVDLYLRVAPNPPYPGFDECFANGVPPNQAAVLAAVQRPATLNQLSEPSGPPAWATIPSWSLIGTQDHAIPPAQLEAMSTHAGAHITFVNAGHLSLITRPDAVTKVILAAVDATT
jgi:pimeloyl-ACP methyl ester carboxylesterase